MARTSPHAGCTKLNSNDKIEILYDAELQDVSCGDKICLCFRCSNFDKERSYMYVRENSIETNEAVECMCSSAWFTETTQVLYYDRAPFKPTLMMGPCCPCCGYTEPKLEVLETGCWCCTKRMVCCSQVVVVPCEAFCCGCCTNRTAKAGPCNCWLCCYGVLGPAGLDGVPKNFMPFKPQPKDPYAFVAAFAKSSGLTVAVPPGQEEMKAKE